MLHSSTFFDTMREALLQDVLVAAPMLLGAQLVSGNLRSEIIEVEAYSTPDVPGCHAHRGATPRNQQMFEAPGTAYVYFTYGNHWMLNVVAHPMGRAGAVLIRAAKPVTGQADMKTRRPKAMKDGDLLSGPGKLCAAYGIHKAHNGLDLLDPRSPLHLLPGRKVSDIITGTRIGLSPGKGDDLPWRFLSADSIAWASRPLPR